MVCTTSDLNVVSQYSIVFAHFFKAKRKSPLGKQYNAHKL